MEAENIDMDDPGGKAAVPGPELEGQFFRSGLFYEFKNVVAGHVFTADEPPAVIVEPGSDRAVRHYVRLELRFFRDEAGRIHEVRHAVTDRVFARTALADRGFSLPVNKRTALGADKEASDILSAQVCYVRHG